MLYGWKINERAAMRLDDFNELNVLELLNNEKLWMDRTILYRL